MIDTSTWKEFPLVDYFDIEAGIYHYPNEYDEGTTPYVSASNENNGIGQYISLPPDFEGNKIVTGKVGCTAFYEPEPFCATSDVNIFTPKFDMSANVGIFLATLINFNENYKWAYGRQCRVGNSKKIKILLPAAPSGEPDWQYMEDFVGGLHSKPITTSVKSSHLPLETEKWKEFNLKNICHITMGNKMDFSAMTMDNPTVNFVGRSADDNGVAAKVDAIKGIKPYDAGCITVALGGSLGSSYLQTEPFYTSQNVAVLEFDNTVSDLAKVFVSCLIMNESKYKYFPFGRELNTHIRTDFAFTLPIQYNADGTPFIDADKKYSDDGYVPDWQYMEDYIKSLPYGDKLEVSA